MALAAKEKYDPNKIAKHLDYIRLCEETKRPVGYEIIVDKMKVVHRTSDPELFEDYARFVDGDTKTVEILIYHGSSNNHDRYIYTFSDALGDSLAGIDLESKITEQVERHKRDLQYGNLEREHSELRRDYAELEKDYDQLETEHKALQEQQSPFKGLLGEIGSTFVESFIRRNPQLMKSIPGGEALSGLINTPAKADEPSAEGSVSFQPKSESGSLTEDQQAAISFVDQLKIQFQKEEFDRVVTILQSLAEDKQRINIVLNVLSNRA